MGRLLACLLLIAACGGGSGDDDDTGAPDAGFTPPDPGPVEPFPDKVCPGGDGCATADGPLRVGAAKVDITPELVEYEWDDEDGDGKFDSGEAFTDVNGNGKFDAVWIAGSSTGRAARGVHDPLWARALVIERGDTRVAIVVVDVIGWFVDDVDEIRDQLPTELAIDHVIMTATHNHQGPDTLGQWGRAELDTGLDPDYMARVQQAAITAISESVAGLEPVLMTVAQVPTVDEDGWCQPFVSDARDPNILDPRLTLVRFASAGDPTVTVGTLVHWAAHPEYVNLSNNLLSSDVLHHIRETIETGAPESMAGPAVEGLGGVAVYVQGAVGGQIGPIGVQAVAADGTIVTGGGFPRAEAAGVNVGRLGLLAMSDAELAEDVADPALHVRTGTMFVRIENVLFHVAGLVGVFDRQFMGYDESKPIGEGNMPFVQSRVSYLQLGPVAAITAPGELHPELFVGGYDGSESWGMPMTSDGNVNPPDVGQAPAGPYVRDLVLENPGVRYPLVFGLGEDMLGYIVPAWNYELADGSPYLEEAPGDHYEETNSVGPDTEAHIVGAMRALVTWRP